MKLRSDFRTAVTIMNRLHRDQFLFINTKGGFRLLLLPAHHGVSGMTTGGTHKIHQSEVPLSS